MANNGKPTVDPNSLARRLLASVCFVYVGFLLVTHALRPEFPVDVPLVIVLVVAGSGLVGIDLKFWG